MHLKSNFIDLEFATQTGTLSALYNRLTKETYTVAGDRFAVEALEFRFPMGEFCLAKRQATSRLIQLLYRNDVLDVEVTYTLEADRHFAEKKVAITSRRECGLKRVVLSQLRFVANGLKIVCYSQPHFGRIQRIDEVNIRAPGFEPVRTFFGRTAKGGFFTGIEMPFDDSQVQGAHVTLAFAPSLWLKAGERFECEPVYFGVYRRQALDKRATQWRPADGPVPPVLPLPSESQAMVAMTSAVLGPRRFGLLATACSWHSEMEQQEYTAESLAGDLRSLEVIQECGMDAVSDSHPWGGEFQKMNNLREGDRFEPGPEARQFLDRARALGLQTILWPTMNNTQPWGLSGKPFLADKQEWQRLPLARKEKTNNSALLETPSNCIAHRPFYEWIKGIMFDAMDTGCYSIWGMDGDFWGWGGYFHSTLPAECAANQHDHLPGDSNFASQRALDRMVAAVRERYPKTPIVIARPSMDLGVWSQRNIDSCFTLIETGTASSNIAGGDEIRTVSRIRVHHHFFPHTIDWSLLFPSYMHYVRYKDDPRQRPQWPSEKIDYIMLSALSCAPNLLFYLPTKTGFPDADKAEIRKWLDWGRKNIEYVNVRRDLPDWPQVGKVDGSAHIIGDRGWVFLFNSSKQPLIGRFRMNEESIGLSQGKQFQITQFHPAASASQSCRLNETVKWEVPAESAVVLEVNPAKNS